MSQKDAFRNLRQMAIFSGGRRRVILVNKDEASKIGRYFDVIGRFLRSNDLAVLAQFVGSHVEDAEGKQYVLESDPNTLYGLAQVEPDLMDPYRIPR